MDLAQSREENFGKESHLLRNQIINEYLPYVKRIVNRIAVHLPATIEVDDLINVGIIGLIQAIERYDPTRDNKFITYAVFRIKGAVLSGFGGIVTCDGPNTSGYGAGCRHDVN